MASSGLPGFRFRPTAAELVMFYLKRKVIGTLPDVAKGAIPEINVLLYSPHELPEKSSSGSKDRKCYFFCPVEKKYASGSRANRKTEKGYWKSTGKDRPVNYEGRTVGMIKTLVFHEGQSPNGRKTDWFIYEYRLEDEQLSDDVCQGTHVLCKVFRKTQTDPFKEEDWPYEEVRAEPGPSLVTREVEPDNDNSTLLLPSMEDTGSLPIENDNNENISNLNQERSVEVGQGDGDDFYNELENLGNLVELDEGRSSLSESWAAQQPKNIPFAADETADFDFMRFPLDYAAFLELEDLEIPIFGTPNLADTSYPSYNSLTDAEPLHIRGCISNSNQYGLGVPNSFAETSGGRLINPLEPLHSNLGDAEIPLNDNTDTAYLELNDLDMPLQDSDCAIENEDMVIDSCPFYNSHFEWSSIYGDNQYVPGQNELHLPPQQYS